MKKTLLLAMIIIIYSSLFSQQFYADINAGYGFGFPNTTLWLEHYTDLDEPKNSHEINHYGTLGKGLNLSITPGYMFNKHIGVELGINYFMGAETKLDTCKTTSNPDLYDVTEAKSNQLRIIPSVVFNTGGEKLFGYAKLGAVVPVAGSTKATRSTSLSVLVDPINHKEDVYSNEFKATVSGSFSVGVKGALGIGYHFSELISLKLEVFCTSLHIKNKKQTVESIAYVNGEVVESPESKVYYTEINFVDELNADSNNSLYNDDFDENSPKEELAKKTNFSQFGISLGLSFSF